MKRIGLVLLASVALIGAAAAADMPVKAPVYKAPVMDPPFSWTGLYVGGNLGYSWGRQDVEQPPNGSSSAKLNGIIGGGQIGYNWQMNQWVFGLEADFQGSGQKGDGSLNIGSTFQPNLRYSGKLDWFGTVRGRVGYAQDRWLAYLTGGWAYGHGSFSGSSTIPVSAYSASTTYSGWTAGAGLEWAFANHWSAKAEYLYIDFGNGPSLTQGGPPFVINLGKMTDNILRLGVNYKF